jgi:uncharacterized protein
MKENIVIFGGTGFLGRKLISELRGNFNITIATRNIQGTKSGFKDFNDVIIAEYSNSPDSTAKITALADIVINLSGASIAGRRWNDKYKSILYASRIDTTRLIVSSFGKLSKIPRCFISASAVGIYGNRYDEILTENSRTGNDFLAKMCADWENEALKAEVLGIRTVCIRTGIVLDRDEGAFARMALPFKFFIGGTLANGKQFMPWIHSEDIVRIFSEAVKNNSLTGIINGTSPNPITNYEFSKTLGRILMRPTVFRVPEFALTIVIGELARFIIASQRVYPEKLTATDFTFRFPDIESAIKNILK